MHIAKANRIKSHQPKLAHMYCGSCDRAKVAIGGKCHVCGSRCGLKRLKRSMPVVIDYGEEL